MSENTSRVPDAVVARRDGGRAPGFPVPSPGAPAPYVSKHNLCPTHQRPLIHNRLRSTLECPECEYAIGCCGD